MKLRKIKKVMCGLRCMLRSEKWNEMSAQIAFKLISFQKSLPHYSVFLINMITELLRTATTEKIIFFIFYFLDDAFFW